MGVGVTCAEVGEGEEGVGVGVVWPPGIVVADEAAGASVVWLPIVEVVEVCGDSVDGSGVDVSVVASVAVVVVDEVWTCAIDVVAAADVVCVCVVQTQLSATCESSDLLVRVRVVRTGITTGELDDIYIGGVSNISLGRLLTIREMLRQALRWSKGAFALAPVQGSLAPVLTPPGQRTMANMATSMATSLPEDHLAVDTALSRCLSRTDM